MDDLEYQKLDVFQRIEAIEKCLLTQDPRLPTHLAVIHSTLIKYEELAHLLSDEQIRMLIAGQKKHAGTELVKESIKSKTNSAAKNKALSRTTVDDL
jgi:hypothetical protein